MALRAACGDRSRFRCKEGPELPRRRLSLTLIACAVAAALGGPARAAAAPVALWHMDETSGSTMADAVGAHDGTLDQVELGRAGFSGTAYGFTGASSVSVPSRDDLNPHGQDMTVTAHLKTTEAPANPDWDIVRKGVFSDPGEYKMEFQPSGQ